MGLRKGRCYNKINKRPYTRKSKVKSKSYLKTIPAMKIAKFVMGDIKGFFKKKYLFNISLITLEPVQIRDNAIEASRQMIHRHLEKKLKGSYYFSVSAYPHHVLRENKMLTGAGADRMQTGMQLSFGKPVGIAARIKAGGKIFTIACDKEMLPTVRTIFSKVRPKIPGKKSIRVEKIR
ncbi:MAG: 50S ribosomal protein L16 [Candidatus Pacearchaeota archaeon]|nr:MAG: 50S ribosomal protein L16 [Candidatus Pacearchaeota archaeon]